MTDFGVAVAVFPSTYFCNNSESCDVRIYMALYWFFLHSSVTNLCTLTWNRYIAIVHPLRYNTSITETRPGMVILVAWLISLVISLSRLVGMFATNSDSAQIVFRLTGISGFESTSGVLLFYAVVRILVVARAQSYQVTAMERQVRSNHSSNEPSETAASRRREKHNTAWFIIALIVFFLGCYIVVNFLLFCTTFEFPCKLPHDASQAFTLLLVLNSAVNPLVYAFLKKDIKMEVKTLICREI